jgi:hypothetical protein
MNIDQQGVYIGKSQSQPRGQNIGNWGGRGRNISGCHFGKNMKREREKGGIQDKKKTGSRKRKNGERKREQK